MVRKDSTHKKEVRAKSKSKSKTTFGPFNDFNGVEKAIKSFCKKHRIPQPDKIDSGANAIYGYWKRKKHIIGGWKSPSHYEDPSYGWFVYFTNSVIKEIKS